MFGFTEQVALCVDSLTSWMLPEERVYCAPSGFPCQRRLWLSNVLNQYEQITCFVTTSHCKIRFQVFRLGFSVQGIVTLCLAAGQQGKGRDVSLYVALYMISQKSELLRNLSQYKYYTVTSPSPKVWISRSVNNQNRGDNALSVTQA